MKYIKVLLTENVEGTGIVGDVVEVRPGFARNFLLPRGMATDPTPGNVKRLASRRAVVEKEMQIRREQLEALLEKLKGYELTLQRSANEQGILFGGVSQHDISEALKAEGLDVDDRAVRIGQQIKRLDSYMIPIVLASDLKTDIKLWVVSDKPAVELAAEPEEAEAAPAAQDAAVKEAKPKKKPRKAKGEEAKAEEAEA
ncbi:MAG: 50S ribosomal protein L9 [Phycisphaeraceae bacterium]